MNIIQAHDDLQYHWDEFVKHNALDGGLLQSWRWGDFQKTLGHRIFRLALLDEAGTITAVALIVRHELQFEYSYLYCPRGPVIAPLAEKNDVLLLFQEIKKIAADEKSFMIRLDPAWLSERETLLREFGFRQSDQSLQPQCNFMINIAKADPEILAGMKQKTRYNIALAQKKGVTIRVSNEVADIEAFWELMKQTAKRDSFKSHLKEHYTKLFEAFKADQTIQMFLAEYDHKIVAAAMISFFGRVATYLHGASSDLYRGVMAPYALHWQGILEAKKLDCHYYDFGGVNGAAFYDKRWEGITRFKTGFSQTTPIKEYVGGYEAVLNPFIFAAYKFIKQIRD